MFIFLYIVSLILIVCVLLKINNFHLFDDALVFSSLTNYLLVFAQSLFTFYFENYLFSFVSSILLIIFTILLLYDFKRILGYLPIASILYLFMNIYLLITTFLNLL